MLDLHSHILPGLDDGPETTSEALLMAKLASDDGIRGMVVTPHIMRGVYTNNRDTILSALEAFQRRIRREGIDLDLLPGSEVFLDHETLDLFARGDLVTINDKGRFLLLEFGFQTIPSCTEDVLFHLMIKGVVPILAHPERNRSIIENPEILADFVDRGVLVQLNAGSLLGSFGPEVKKTAELLLLHGLAHVVATDCHSAENRRPLLRRVRNKIADLAGEETAQALLEINPARIIDGKD
ncbi:MAG: protein-tyrosine phosphatase, partial [Eubacteriales bacterium]|nr:protein-tyrosine phosphatase [Eubacteriales bacterium]